MPAHRSPQTPVAIVGVGAILPGALDVAGFWRNVLDGRDLITEVPDTHWLVTDYYDPDPSAPDKTYARRGAFIPEIDFDPMASGIPPADLPTIDPAQILALLGAGQVLADVARSGAETDKTRVGVILGASTLVMYHHMASRLERPVWLSALREHGVAEPDAQAICDRIAEHYTPWRESSAPGLLTNVVAGRVANRFDLHGRNYTVDAACASSLAAISAAVNELELGQADMVITGGVDVTNTPTMYTFFSKTPALSPSGDCRPFSDAADGTMLGEGLAMFALKRLHDAECDGDQIYAVIRGVGGGSDGRGNAIFAPAASGQAEAIRHAYAAAGYPPATVGLVEAHGTGTKAGDLAEFTALRDVFADDPAAIQRCALGSVKSQLGHTRSAAGAVGLLKAVLALRHATLPPTIKVDLPNPALDLATSPFYLNTTARPWLRDHNHPRRAAVSSFGFGGTNFHMTVEEYQPSVGSRGRLAPLCRATPSELVLFGADSPATLAAMCRECRVAGALDKIASASQRKFSSGAACRLAIVVADTDDLAGKLAVVADHIQRQPDTPFTTPQGIYYDPRPGVPGAVAFVFPGQGSHYVGMGADLAMHFPQARAVWEHAVEHELGGAGLHKIVFPVPVFTAGDRTAQDEQLTMTENAQPALALQSLALLRLLDALKVRPECLAGHSLGELIALHAAGTIDADDLLRVTRRRGELMRALTRAPSAMLAVTASRTEVAALLPPDEDREIWIANHNAPSQVVLSGRADAIETTAETLSRKGLTVRRLKTAAAFHTPLVASATEPMLDFLSDIPVAEPMIEVYGNADAAPYPKDPAYLRRRIAEHLALPVRFVDQIEAMYAGGVRTFVEVGAGSVLSGLIEQILCDRAHLAVSLDRKGVNGVTSLHQGLGRLAAHGVEMDFTGLWESDESPEMTAASASSLATTVKITGTNYGKSYPPPGGANALPKPNPVPASTTESTRRAMEPAAVRPAPQEPTSAMASWRNPESLRALQQVQRQINDTHAAYQQLMADSHLAFLKAAESSLSRFAVVDGSTAPHPDAVAMPAQPTMALPDFPPPAPAPAGPVAAPSAQPEVVSPLQALLEVVADKTGYLVQTLNSGMDLEADLGIDSIRRVQVLATLRDRVDGMPDPKSVRMRQLLRLRTLGEIAEQLGETATPPVPARQPSMPAATVSTPPRRMITRAVAVPAPGLAMPGLGSGHLAVTDDGSGVAQHVVEHLAAHGICARICAEPPSDAIGLIVLGHSAEAQSPDGGAAAQRAAFRAARTIAPALMTDQGVFVTVQDTGGDFGLNGRSGEFVWAGGLAGLARTAAKEWPRASVKAIDCHRAGRTTIDIAHAIVEELVTGGPALNVGLPADGARLTLETVPAPIVTSTGGRLGPESVVVATGGARGVTAAALRELAMAYQPRILLIGRTPLVDEPAELSDARDEVALISRLSTQSRQPAAPAELAARARALLAAREVRGTLAELAKAGATVRYAPMDVTQVDALSAVLDEVRREWGPIDGIVHGAGVLADKQIADKTDEQFDRVFDTKVRGLAALLTATADDPLRLLCVFSSVAARYGNPGQCDYAMANETLTQVLVAERARRPDCLVRAIAWGPWEGGMVTPALAEHFRSEDVAMIPLAQGARAFVDELAGPAADVQVIITAEPELGTAAEYGVCAEAHLDEKSHPQLSDHEIDGVPVLPLAVGLDIMARLARSCRPADEGIVVRDVQAVRRIKLPDLSGGGHRLLVKANPGADTVLEMRFLDDAAPRLRARFIGGEPLRAATWMLPPDLEPFDQSDIYDGHVLFHGPGFQVLQAVHGISDAGALATVAGLADRGWTGEHWQTDPAAVDGCLQLALLWANRVVGATLPVGVTQLRLHRTGPLPGSALCVVRAREIEDGQANCDVVLFDEAGPTRIELLGVTLVQRPA